MTTPIETALREELAEAKAELEQLKVRYENRSLGFDAVTRELAEAKAALEKAEKALAVLADAISNGEDLHTESCPEDDTCVCRLVSVINAALACHKERTP